MMTLMNSLKMELSNKENIIYRNEITVDYMQFY